MPGVDASFFSMNDSTSGGDQSCAAKESRFRWEFN